MTKDKIALKTQNLTIGYANSTRTTHVVAEDINVDLAGGELVCLLGPNGIGKSTLIRTLARMQPPLAGRIWLGKDDLQKLNPGALARRLSVVLTERVHVGVMSAYALVTLGRHPYTDWMGRLTEADEAVVRWAITAVGATHLSHRPVNELSDGERQKIMIARALAQEPQIMILDEPTAFLDLPHRVEIMQILRKLAREEKRTVLLSTHDLDLALRTADKLWLMTPGKQLRMGTPEDLVLTGAFEQAFQSKGVEFDAQAGAFKIQNHTAGHVDLTGEGLAAIWATRALEREGYQVHQGENGAAIRVRAQGENGRSQWRLTIHNQTHSYDSIQDLLQGLRQPGD